MEVASSSPFPLSWCHILGPEPQWLPGTSGHRDRRGEVWGEGDEAEKINQVDRGIHPPPWDHEHRACPGGNWLSQPRGEAQGRMVQEGAGSRSSTNTGIESQPPGVTQSSLGLWLQTCCVALASHAPFWASAFSFIKGNFDDENTVSFKELSMGSDAIMLTKM